VRDTRLAKRKGLIHPAARAESFGATLRSAGENVYSYSRQVRPGWRTRTVDFVRTPLVAMTSKVEKESDGDTVQVR
jgi:hypothetical protein